MVWALALTPTWKGAMVHLGILAMMLLCGATELQKGAVLIGGIWGAIIVRDVRRWRDRWQHKKDPIGHI